MQYRGIEYSVVQGIRRNLWKWSASVANVVITGQSQRLLGQYRSYQSRRTDVPCRASE